MIKKVFFKYEYVLFFTTVFLCAFGLLLLYSASSYYCINNYHNEYYLVLRQGVFIVAGFIVLIVVSFIPYQVFLKSSFIIYMASLFLVMLTFFAGVASRGATRWIDIRGITFQPSELMKIGIILHLSSLCGKFIENKDRYDEIRYQKEYYKILATGLIPSVVISAANLSTGIICAFITLCYVFLLSKKKLVFLVIILLIASIFFFKYPIALIIEKIGLLKKYQMNRIFAWVSPKEYEDVAYQTNQSLYAIGSGGIWGRGIGESLQKMRIPEAQNDMIFAILVEETGIVGALFFI
ncbi:MAG: FtsW/RodA/SpoVE family cell cycle protein, partial [Lachnospiraceae bacterium]|nr:FtsW/RodA/SpoVE family cell cycle protein [Lachnospiraceae bacterium]